MSRRASQPYLTCFAVILGFHLLSASVAAQSGDPPPPEAHVQITTADDFPDLNIGIPGQAALDATAWLDPAPPGNSGGSGTDNPPVATYLWEVTNVEYKDKNGDWQTAAAGDAYVYIDPNADPTVAAATLNGTFFIATIWRVSVRVTASFTIAGVAYTAQDEKKDKDAPKAKVKDKTYDFRSNGAITIEPHTSPPDGSLVSPKQTVTLILRLTDKDQYKETGAANWIDFWPQASYPGKYTVKLTLTNAKFPGGAATKTFDAFRSPTINGYFWVNPKIVIDKDWDGTNPVKIDIVVTDLLEVPADVKLGPGINRTDIRDADTNLAMQWKKAKKYPTELKRVAQNPGAVGSLQTTEKMIVTQQAGTDAAPAYQGVTVDEIFPSNTSNLKKAWLTPAIQNSQPTWDDAKWQNYYFGGGTGNNITGTFAIDANNKFDDEYSGTVFVFAQNGLSVNSLSNEGKKATLSVQFDQQYECPPGTVLRKASIKFEKKKYKYYIQWQDGGT